MKRINMILMSEEQKPADTPVLENLDVSALDPAMEASLAALDTTLMMYPEMANDPAIKELIAVKEAHAKANPIAAPAVTTTAATVTVDADPLLDIPFFKTVKGADFSKAKVEELPSIVKDKFGIDTSNAEWFPKFLETASKANDLSAKLTEAEDTNKELVDSINSLPRELQESVRAFLDDKDWRSVFTGATLIDYSADFGKLSNEDKIKVHNYLFPDDIIETTADVADKAVGKALRTAESKFNSEKKTVELGIQQKQSQTKEDNKNYLSSVDTSLTALKTAYPEFSHDELKNVEKIIKKDGIASVFFDKKGNALPDAAEKLAFAINGKKVLTAAVAIAKNKGKSDGKAEILQTVNTQGGGGKDDVLKNVTDEEKRVAKILQESFVDVNLTY